jgi:Thymidine kinase
MDWAATGGGPVAEGVSSGPVAEGRYRTDDDSDWESDITSLVSDHTSDPVVYKVRVLLGPRFAGKTTRLLQEAIDACRQWGGERVAVVKATRDDRCSATAVCPHDSSLAPVTATHVVDQLSDVNVDGIQAVYIDNLHLFGAWESTLATWQEAGVAVTATSLA